MLKIAEIEWNGARWWRISIPVNNLKQREQLVSTIGPNESINVLTAMTCVQLNLTTEEVLENTLPGEINSARHKTLCQTVQSSSIACPLQVWIPLINMLIFLPHLYKQLENSQRLDVVWDTYIPDSLKGSTGGKRATHPFQLLKADSEHFKKLERLTAVLYDETTPFNSINQLRKELFCQKNRAMDKLPSTGDALLQHIRRAVYEAGICTTSTKTQQVIPSPHDSAWDKVLESWVPVWMTIPEVSRSCRELIKCSCKGDCSNCKCGKANLDCSPLYKCKCNLQ
ncbi:hypothetical protein JTB14_017678 [Gonioctena quinquepunctata]|nr:hypothetical protein JTB14_017678 [Gonioctena quinquepunctata]